MEKSTKRLDAPASGDIGRRDFLTLAAALGATTALTTSLGVAPASAEMPKRGGRFRIGAVGGATTDNLDPAQTQDFMVANINWQTRNNLCEIDHNQNVIPELAESWEPSADAAQWVFKLRKGVEFHNGKTLDSADVVYSINHHRGEETESAAKSLLASVTDLKADGKDTVVFTLDGGSADFPYVLADYHMSIFPDGTENFDDGMGTGGYILESFDPGVRALSKRNPNYWKEGRAHFDEIETLGIADGTARTSALRSGDLDAMLRADRKTVDRLAQTPGIQVVEVPGSTHVVLPMLVDRPPFDNNELRLAMKYAIDREKMVETILRGHGTVGNDHPIAPVNKHYAKEIPTREYDPDKARFHLKKAGLENFAVKLHASDLILNVGVDTAVLYKEHAAKADIDIEVVVDPPDGYWNDIWRNVPFFEDYYSGRPTEDWMFSLVYAAEAAWNNTFWKHERFNKLLKEARAQLDESKRHDMYVEMQRICRDEGAVVIPYFLTNLDAVSDKVRFGPVAGNFEFDGWRAHERWWFA